ncbi:MAG: hypothetical protein ABSB81_03560 [Halobacteriota archaeon]
MSTVLAALFSNKNCSDLPFRLKEEAEARKTRPCPLSGDGIGRQSVTRESVCQKKLRPLFFYFVPHSEQNKPANAPTVAETIQCPLVAAYALLKS